MLPKLVNARKAVQLVLLFFGFSLSALAQEVVTGKIFSADRKPISGATITVKGTDRRAMADQNGDYRIVAGSKEVLVISSVGFGTLEVSAGEASSILLSEDSKNLSEVVVTALGVKKEIKKIGYSVQEVKGEDLVRARDQNPISGLTGKVAGLSVGPSAELLRKPTVLLRGNEITLYVVDGIPISSDTWNISPDDIESYTILKGPTAAALYG
ncbi:MAG TPA: carboxypeptidase-like regulatory domain-containing protein, partial [Chitinophagaceae bacterium]|nr:carboxypeptidase-like regulatory domain-containing protein [Chitinophagaceae bacterium]